MGFTKEQNQLINRMVEELQEENLAIFAGAGFSIGAGYLNWKDLLRPLSQDLGLDIDQEHDLISVAQYYLNANGRSRLAERLINALGIEAEPTQNHNVLARLPISTYWTTNYDCLIEDALKIENKLPDVKYTIPHLAVTRKGRSAVVYKMHGDISHSSEAIITKDQYESYSSKFSPFVTALSGDLVSKTFIFLGFSFSDPNLDYVLSRVRVSFSDHQRQHFAVFRKVNQQDFDSNTSFENAQTKQELFIKDISRFRITVVLIDGWGDLTNILEAVERKYKKRTIFLSGSAHEFGSWGQSNTEQFLSKLGDILIQRNYKIVSGLGLGIGNAFVSGGIKAVYTYKYGDIDSQITMKPFPQHVESQEQRRDIWSKFRRDLISRAGIAIFFMGNRKAGEEIEHAYGMQEEFDLAKELGLMLVPIGGSGYISKVFYNEVLSQFNEHFQNASDDVFEKFKALGEDVEEPDHLISKILDFIDAVN